MRTRIRRTVFLVFCAVVLCSHAATQATYYVDPVNGLDNNNGTSAATPFKTLARARDAVRTINTNMTGDIIVNLRQGRYELSSTFTLGSQDCGTNGKYIIYQAYTGEKPVISGGSQVSGWFLFDQQNNIYRSNVGTTLNTRQVYVNGVRAIRARSVDGKGWTWSGGDGYNCPSYVASWKNITAVEVVAKWQWEGLRGPIASVSGTRAVMANPYWGNTYAQSGANASTIAWIENAYELLDEPGEWYLDGAAGYLYYKPWEWENMTSSEVIVARVEQLVTGSNVHHVQFKGITFSHATWIEPNTTNGYACFQADQLHGGSGAVLGNIVFDHSNTILFQDNIFEHLGATAIKLGAGCNNMTISGNSFLDISGSGIAEGVVAANPAAAERVSAIAISNNIFQSVANEYWGSIGILFYYADHITITHNEIGYLPYSGVSIGWGWGASSYATANRVDSNYIHDVMQKIRDGGGIYTLSPQSGSSITGNYIKNVMITQTATDGFGIYLDQNTGYFTIANNVCENSTGYWLKMQSYQTGWRPNDCVVNNNYTNKTAEELAQCCNNMISNNHYETSAPPWSAGAQTICATAGRQNAVAPVQITMSGTEFVDSTILSLSTTTSGAQIYYTLNGKEPDQSSALYTSSMVVRALNYPVQTIKVKAFKTGLLPSASTVATVSIYKSLQPVQISNLASGVNYKYYEGAWTMLPDFSTLMPVRDSVCGYFTLTIPHRSDSFAVVYTGYLDVLTDDVYSFFLSSEDGSELFIGNSLVVNNDGLHGITSGTAKRALKTGKHPITVYYFKKSAIGYLSVSWQGLKQTYQTIPAERLFHATGNSVIHSIKPGQKVLKTGFLNINNHFIATFAEPGKHQLDIFTCTGKIVKSIEGASTGQYVLDNKMFSRGTYIVRIQTRNYNQSALAVFNY